MPFQFIKFCILMFLTNIISLNRPWPPYSRNALTRYTTWLIRIIVPQPIKLFYHSFYLVQSVSCNSLFPFFCQNQTSFGNFCGVPSTLFNDRTRNSSKIISALFNCFTYLLNLIIDFKIAEKLGNFQEKTLLFLCVFCMFCQE